MLKFHCSENGNTITFEQIKEGQFFIDGEGCLMQKSSEDAANQITDKNGVPYPIPSEIFDSNDVVERLPHVNRITWK